MMHPREPFSNIVVLKKPSFPAALFDWDDLRDWLNERDLLYSKDAIVSIMDGLYAVQFNDPVHAVAYKMKFG